jgi:hypothetical protein
MGDTIIKVKKTHIKCQKPIPKIIEIKWLGMTSNTLKSRILKTFFNQKKD